MSEAAGVQPEAMDSTNKIPTKAALQAGRAAMMGRIADVAARNLGFTPAQRAAYFEAIVAAPLTTPSGAPVPIHDMGLAAVAKVAV